MVRKKIWQPPRGMEMGSETLLQIVQIHQQNFERLIAEFQRHRSDGQAA
jgi:hypothetical protein